MKKNEFKLFLSEGKGTIFYLSFLFEYDLQPVIKSHLEEKEEDGQE